MLCVCVRAHVHVWWNGGMFRAQQSSREAKSEECFSVWGGGHLEAAALEQQPQTHPGLRGQSDSINNHTHQTVLRTDQQRVSDSVRILIQSDRNVVLLIAKFNDTWCVNYSYYCGFSCSTGVRGRSQTLLMSLGRWGIKLQHSSGTWRAGAPIMCPCGPTTALEWVHRATQSMSQPKNHVSAFHYDPANGFCI